MRLVSFNINGIRARLHQLRAIVDKHDPEVIALQETKVADDEFPREAVEELGYEVHIHGQKGHYGVAVMTRNTPGKVVTGLPWDGCARAREDDQRRFMAVEYPLPDGKRLRFINGYFPQGGSRDDTLKFRGKEQFYAGVQRYLQEHCDPDDPVMVAGDMNVAPVDLDIGISKENKERWLARGKSSFLPEERAWLNAMLGWGLADTYRVVHPTEDARFSWFDYRIRGFERKPKRGLRIDLLLASASLTARLTEAGIDYDIRSMDKPSDHCPVWAQFDL
ncbi:MAG: exodeoxyribonuclease III [Pseudomonadales bacterium]